MPHSVEMPAPVNGTIHEASAIMLPSCSTPLRKSLAITAANSEWLGRADYSTALRIARSVRPARPRRKRIVKAAHIRPPYSDAA
jgi:hypothetical protein